MAERRIKTILDLIAKRLMNITVPVTVWTNPDPTAEFPAQNISIKNITLYEHVELEYRGSATSMYRLNKKMPVEIGAVTTMEYTYNFNSAPMGLARRVVTVTEDGVTIAECQRKSYYDSGAGVYTDYAKAWVLPLRIIGYTTLKNLIGGGTT